MRRLGQLVLALPLLALALLVRLALLFSNEDGGSPAAAAEQQRRGSLLGHSVHNGTNIVFVKVMKTASSTVSGALRRVCVHHGLSGCRAAQWIRTEPGLWAKHGPFDASWREALRHRFARDYDSRERPQPPDLAVLSSLARPTFLMTLVREPAARCLSQHYYFHAGAITDASKLRALSRCVDYQTRYLWPRGGAAAGIRHGARGAARAGAGADASAARTAPHSATRIIGTYDLVGTTERLDETLVLVAAAIGVPLGHVLTAGSAKNSSLGRRDPETHRLAPRHPPLALEPEAVRAYARGPEFAARNAQDLELWRGATARIDAALGGSAPLRAARDALRGLQARARALCAPSYTADGYKADGLRCLFNDQACNYECLDRHFAAGAAGAPGNASLVPELRGRSTP